MSKRNAAAVSGASKAKISLHVPVMLTEVLEALALEDGKTIVDATFGGGGYTEGILKSVKCKVIAFDRDPGAVAQAKKDSIKWKNRLIAVEGCFGDLGRLLSGRGYESNTINGVVMDLGLSSIQLSDPVLGFSFLSDGPLDMRMSRRGETAADVVNSMSEENLAEIFYRFGEERYSRRIAKAITKKRTHQPILRTLQLAELIKSALPKERRTAHGAVTIHPATRTFQALRIYVNDEIGELRRGLAAAEEALTPEGRLAVVSFHSLEDREVKQFFKVRSALSPNVSRHFPPNPKEQLPPSFQIHRRGAMRPSEKEIGINPRSRSARLRWAVRTDAPAWGQEAVA